MAQFWLQPVSWLSARKVMLLSEMPVHQPAAIPRTASDVAKKIVAIAEKSLRILGRLSTYGDLAGSAGSSPRGVASALSSGPHSGLFYSTSCTSTWPYNLFLYLTNERRQAQSSR